MIYGYIRVSSDKHTVENQRFEINSFCEREALRIDGWIEETISGIKSIDTRELGRLLEKVCKGDLSPGQRLHSRVSDRRHLYIKKRSHQSDCFFSCKVPSNPWGPCKATWP